MWWKIRDSLEVLCEAHQRQPRPWERLVDVNSLNCACAVAQVAHEVPLQHQQPRHLIACTAQRLSSGLHLMGGPLGLLTLTLVPTP